METSDAMRSRGYGLPGRTSFCIYRFGRRDAALTAAMVLLISAVIACAVCGAARAVYIPAIALSAMNAYSYIGMGAYALFLAIPSVLSISEDIKWRILKSGI